MNTSKNFFHNCSGNNFSRDYSRGKSFSFSKWSPAITYTNDIFKQDFVNYNGDLYACIKTNTNELPTESNSWYLVIEKIPPINLLPIVDSDGNLTWTERIGNELPEKINIKGPKGDPGEKGEQGIQGIKGDRGEKGEKGDSGSGNMSIGEDSPKEAGYENDIYLDIKSGIFYRFHKNAWKDAGKISVEGEHINMEWQDE